MPRWFWTEMTQNRSLRAIPRGNESFRPRIVSAMGRFGPARFGLSRFGPESFGPLLVGRFGLIFSKSAIGIAKVC